MPVLKIKDKDGNWQEVAGVSGHTHSVSQIVDFPAIEDFATEEYVDSAISSIPTPDVSGQIGIHNIAADAHNDIRVLINGLTTRLNALANSDDTTLDQMNEVVAYIKSNKSLIDSITTNKVNVSDIINNLTTNIANKPLSAAQGVALKGLIDALDSEKLDTSALNDAINASLAQAKASGEFDGADGKDGEDGNDGITPHIGNNGNWFIGTTDTGKPSRGADGAPGKPGETGPAGPAGAPGEDGSDGKDGKTAYQYAKDGGYTGSESDFANKLAKECPTKLSELTNDKGYLTSYTETDPTVPSWAKAATKPSYSKSEVGLGNVDNVKQYSTSNPPVVYQTEAPTDTSVIWVDMDDNNDDGLSNAINVALERAKTSGEFDGKDGTNGEDGVSPTIAVNKSGKVTTVSITDANGTKTATINDGSDGASGKDGTDATVTAESVTNALGYTPLNKDEMFTIRETTLPDYTNQITELEPNSMLTGDGSVKSGEQYVTVFIRVKKGDVIRIKEPSRNDIDQSLMVALYDTNKTISANIGKTINSIATGTAYGTMTINGNTLTWDTSSIAYYFWGDNFAWLRVTVSSADAIVTINEELTESVKEQLILKPTVKVPEENLENASGGKPLVGKTVVCFGDSLFGMYRGADSAPAMIAEYTGATVHNVGFGGCRMSVHPSTGYAAFSMWALAKAVAEKNWTMQDAQAASGSDYFAEQLALLKSIDFGKVDMVVIHYGTNDFKAGGGTTINNDSDHDDYTTLCGALRYSIEKLLGAYPKLQIFVSLPVYRFWTENNVTTYAEDYKWYEHTLPEFVEALRNTAAEYNLPVIDGFYGMGVNKHNASAYLSDGTHHNADGRKLFGEYIGGHLISKQSSGKSGMDVSAVNSLIADAIGNAIGGAY